MQTLICILTIVSWLWPIQAILIWLAFDTSGSYTACKKPITSNKYFYDLGGCSVNNGKCEHLCIPGADGMSYRCDCHEGYELNEDGFTCDGKSAPLTCTPNNFDKK